MTIILSFLCVLLIAILPFLNAGESNIADIIISVVPSLILMTFFIDATKKRRSLQVPRIIAWYVFLTFLWWVYSTFHSVSLIESVFSFWKEMSILSFLLVAIMIIDKKKILTDMAKILSVTALLLSIISFYFLLPGIKPYSADISFFYSTYGHNRLAEYLLIIFPLVTPHLLVEMKKPLLGRIVWLTILLAFLLTFSRLGIALLAVGPLVAFAVNKNLAKRYFSNKLVFVTLFLFGLLLSSVLTTVFMRNTNIQSLKPMPQFTKPLSLVPRVEYFRSTLQKSLEKLWVGFGPGAFQYNTGARFTEAKATSYAHNHLLQRFYETGLPGLAIEVLFLAIFFCRAFKRARKTNSIYLLVTFVGVILSFIHSMLDFGWEIGAVRLTSLFLLLLLQPEEQRSKVGVLWVSPLIFAPLLFLLFISFNSVFNRDKYKQRIDYFDSQNNFGASASLISSWKKIDWGNSQMYQFLAKRDLGRRNYTSATDNLVRSYFAPLRNESFPFDISNRLIDAYLYDLPTPNPERMFSMLEVISKAYSPHDFFWYPSPSYTGKIELVVNDLITRQDELEFTDSMKSLVNYWKFGFLLSKGVWDFDEIYPYIKSASELDLENKSYRLMDEATADLINPKMEDLISKINQISQARFGDDQKPDVYQFLVSLLYQKMAKLQMKDGRFGDAVTSWHKAIEAVPTFGSAYVELALAYHHQNMGAETISVISDCQKIVDPNCLSWYLDEVINQPN